MSLLSIITPTYNRAHMLAACHASLKAQTCRDFHWIVVDDGSTDGTAAAVEGFRADTPWMELAYIRKENGGKHTALNAAHPCIRGDYVLVLDSDDALTPGAVEQTLAAWKRFGGERVGVIYFQKGTDERSPICYVREAEKPVNTLRCKRISLGLGRDCCDTYRADLFVKHPFPVFEGETFLGEGAAFLHIELEARGVYINRVIYLCAYHPDGLTAAGRKMRLQNPRGGRYNSQLYMDRRLDGRTRLKKALLYVCYSRCLKLDAGRILRQTDYPLLALAALLPGTALYWVWRRRYLKGETDGKRP